MEDCEVILTGSFNNWDEQQLKMKKTDSGWSKTLILPGGKHHYKFIVDGEWKVDPENTVMKMFISDFYRLYALINKFLILTPPGHSFHKN